MFSFLVRHAAGGRAADPSTPVRLDIERRVRPGRVAESMTITSWLPEPVTVQLQVSMARDLLPMAVARAGRAPPPPPALDDLLVWRSEEIEARLQAPGATVSAGDAGPDLEWTVDLPARGRATVGWTLEVTDRGSVVVPAVTPPLDAVRIAAELSGQVGDHRLRPWLERSLIDLNGLRMATVDSPEDAFFAAGAPWFLTLFGRDSLWAARMLLPLGTALATSTLRTLARLAGTTVDANSAEAPGKILHELRRATRRSSTRPRACRRCTTAPSTPPRCGSACCTTPGAGACRPRQVERAAAARCEARAGLDGRLRRRRRRRLLRVHRRHRPRPGQPGLEGLRRRRPVPRRPRSPTAPIALCEVQGYAYQAAIDGAALLDAFGRPGGRTAGASWAAALAERFRDRVLGGGRPRTATRRSRWTATSSRSTR